MLTEKQFNGYTQRIRKEYLKLKNIALNDINTNHANARVTMAMAGLRVAMTALTDTDVKSAVECVDYFHSQLYSQE